MRRHGSPFLVAAVLFAAACPALAQDHSHSESGPTLKIGGFADFGFGARYFHVVAVDGFMP